MLALLLLSGTLLPMHVYTPSCVGYCTSTMWRVDVTLPGVMKELFDVLSAVVVACVIVSV